MFKITCFIIGSSRQQNAPHFEQWIRKRSISEIHEYIMYSTYQFQYIQLQLTKQLYWLLWLWRLLQPFFIWSCPNFSHSDCYCCLFVKTMKLRNGHIFGKSYNTFWKKILKLCYSIWMCTSFTCNTKESTHILKGAYAIECT